MDIKHLRYFRVLAKEGNFTKAAKSIRISQPGLSKMIREMESQAGGKLFERGRKLSPLTDRGLVLYPRVERMFKELEGIEEDLSSFRDEIRGNLRFGASDNLTKTLIPASVEKFCARYPKVNVRLLSSTSTQIKEELRRGELDFGIFYTIDRDQHEFHYEKIADIEFVMVAPPSWEKKSRKAAQASLLGIAGITCRKQDYKEAFPTLKMGALMGLSENSRIEINNQEIQIEFVKRGLGFAIVPKHVALPYVKSKEVTLIESETPLLSPLYWVTKKKTENSKISTLFQSELLKHIPSFLKNGK